MEDQSMAEHTLTGNCWDARVAYNERGLNDVCNEHDIPRGDCDICDDCEACHELDE
jgi:hypothetical protein